jgi:pyridoxamine 5'-phosphate oxidase
VIPESPPADPLDLFQTWFAAAKRDETSDPTAMAVASVAADGTPSVRMLLLKGADASGFVFFTNFGSRKAGELDGSGRAALCFHWKVLHRQVRVEGTVARVAAAESDAYFASRPRGSQLAAWASEQSRPLRDRRDLEARVAELERRHAGKPVPRPPFWGGYRLTPSAIEFWQDRPSRLHDRLLYLRDKGRWIQQRLNP